MKPYIVIVEGERTELYSFDDIASAWDYAVAENKAGKRAFPAAVLAAPEFLKEVLLSANQKGLGDGKPK